jgi:hypothetical protein
MDNSCEAFMYGSTTTFVELLEGFFSRRHTRSLADTQESNLQIAIELLWFGQMQCVPQMHLIVDPTKQWGAGQNGFVDVFVSNLQRPLGDSQLVLVMELKNVSLRDLWKARQQDPKAEPASQNQYEPLLNELRRAAEDQLLDLKYSYFDKDDKLVTLQVKGTLQDATTQLSDYIKIISHGQGGPARSGVLDSRVLCQGGGDVLRGWYEGHMQTDGDEGNSMLI